MTLEEFKRHIAPHMSHGWVAMDKRGDWFWYSGNVRRIDDEWIGHGGTIITRMFKFFAVEQPKDWEETCFEVGVGDDHFLSRLSEIFGVEALKENEYRQT